jgi:hypothetical protein
MMYLADNWFQLQNTTASLQLLFQSTEFILVGDPQTSSICVTDWLKVLVGQLNYVDQVVVQGDHKVFTTLWI